LYPQVAQAARRTGRTPPPAAGAQPAAAGPGEPAGALPTGADGAPLAVPVAPAGAAGEGEAVGEAPPQDGARPRAVRRAVALPAAPFGPPRLVRGHQEVAEAVRQLASAGPAAVWVGMVEPPMRARFLVVACANPGASFFAACGPEWPAELAALAGYLADEGCPKWMHDAKSAAVALGRRGVGLAGVAEEVMLASYLLDPGHGEHSLEEMAMAHAGRVVAELKALGSLAPDGEAWVGGWQQAAAERLELIWGLAQSLPAALEQDGLTRVYREIELPLWPVLAEMERTGVCIDTQALKRLGRELAAEMERVAQEIYRLAGEPFNINSPRQLSRILFEKLKLPVVKQTKTGPSTSADVLEELASEHEIVVRILDYRQLVKLKGTYVDPMPELVHPVTGRLHTTFHQAVTATGRLSSSNPNLQNIPVRTDQGAVIREAFVAGEPGWLLMSADYSQIELRVLAHMAQDPTLIEAFCSGQDVHARTAAEVFNVPLEAVTPAMRSGAKAINFGIVYGISPYGLARGTGLSRDDARRFIDRYFQRYPGVKEYLDRTVQKARELGYVTTLFGRRRYLPEIHSRQRAQRAFAERMAMNSPIQGTAADIMKLAMVAVHRRLKEGGWRARMVLQVHDELLLELPQQEVEPVGQLVKQAMEGVVQLAVPLVAEVKTGRSWRDCK
ncbi:MAG TPA: DNA polymerase I, partial [Limnochordales bacterium]